MGYRESFFLAHSKEILMEMGKTVRSAIMATHPEDWAALLRIRAGLSGEATAFYPNTTEVELDDLLWNTSWMRSSRSDIHPDASAFSAAIPGRMLTEILNQVPSATPVTFEIVEGTDMVSAVVPQLRERWARYTVIILRPAKTSLDEPISNKKVVYDFHPGPPTQLSQIKAQDLIGQTLSAEEALKLGFFLAKIKKP
jgi:hypothetical protein